MKYILTFFICLLPLIGFCASPPKVEEISEAQKSPHYRKTVTSISYENKKSSILAKISLSDQTCWKFVLDASEENFLKEFQKDVKVGQEIFFKTLNKSPRLSLGIEKKSLCCPYFVAYPVNPEKESISLLPTLIKSEEEFQATEGNKGAYTFHLTLSDGSHWHFTAFQDKFKIETWKTGDRILVTRRLKHWCLINIDAPYRKKGLDLRELTKFNGKLRLVNHPNGEE